MFRGSRIVGSLCLVILAASFGPAAADCPLESPSGCPFSGAQIAHNYQTGGTCYRVWYGGYNSEGAACMGICESGDCEGVPELAAAEPLDWLDEDEGDATLAVLAAVCTEDRSEPAPATTS
jgi:hypothetical protein